jgi:hypothetical protein
MKSNCKVPSRLDCCRYSLLCDLFSYPSERDRADVRLRVLKFKERAGRIACRMDFPLRAPLALAGASGSLPVLRVCNHVQLM